MKMGFLKDVFKKDTETLVVDRRKEALRSLIIFCVVLVVALLLLVFIRSLTNVDEIRRANITKDKQKRIQIQFSLVQVCKIRLKH